MERGKQSLAYLDTHIVVWLYAGLTEKFTEKARKHINDSDVIISQVVRLELQYLYEIGRINVKPHRILNQLAKVINLKLSDCTLSGIITEALKIDWTRDVFDRLLIAEANTKRSFFITADKNIIKHFKLAVW